METSQRPISVVFVTFLVARLDLSGDGDEDGAA